MLEVFEVESFQMVPKLQELRGSIGRPTMAYPFFLEGRSGDISRCLF